MKKKTGRPRLAPEDASVQMSIRLPVKQFDATHRQATDARLTMSAWICQMLERGSFVSQK